MYKVASRNLQSRHRVNRPLPTGGMLGLGTANDQDFIPSAGNMSLEECLSELRQLGVELVRAENELSVAKSKGSDSAQVRLLGHRIQTIVQRRGIVKNRVNSIRDQDDPSATLAEAIRQVAPDDLQKAIFERAKLLNKQKYKP